MPASVWVEMICVILGASGSRLLTAQILQEDLFFRSARSTLDLRGAQQASEKAGKLCCVSVSVKKGKILKITLSKLISLNDGLFKLKISSLF